MKIKKKMAQILTLGKESPKDKKENPLKGFWDFFLSQDKFTRSYIVVVLLMIMSTPFIVGGRTIFRQHAATTIPAFGLGLEVGPGDTWIPDSGIPWNYGYQYLAGDVNGSNWDSWNPNGTFVTNYASEKYAQGVIPVFSYYLMCQSQSGCYTDGAHADLSGLNSASNMKNYFNNFRELMKRLGSGTYDGIKGYGKVAIVQVEPDLSAFVQQAVNGVNSCYTFCTGTGNNPALLKAVVKSTGDPDVANYPDTYQGFNWALLHLRDLYAPNVKLAFHINNWATGIDIGSDSNSSTNAVSLGQEAGQFANLSGAKTVPAGLSTYDFIFSDPLDRDAGYYKYVYKNPSVWWDRLNKTVPNFNRYESYIGAVHQTTGKSIFIWQIPVGNQYFDTENNTNNHYQDNRVEYFLGQNLDPSTSHIAELQSAGVIGLLFGPGAGGQSSYKDQAPDGITNPPSFCTTDGISTGQICNNHKSIYADDDGGYLRLMAAKFYNVTLPSPTAAPTPTPTPTPPPPASQPYVLYDGKTPNLADGWGDLSYNTPPQYDNTSPVRSGEKYSIKAYIPQYQAFSISTSSFQDGAYGSFDFWVQADGPGAAFNVEIFSTEVGASAYIVGGDTSFVPGKWEHVSIPLAALSAANQTISRITLIGRMGDNFPTLYFSDISFVPSSTNPTPTPVSMNTPFLLYDSQTGSLANGFADHSYTSPQETTFYGNTSPVLSGRYSVKAVIPPWNAFGMTGTASTAGYKALDFWVQAGGAGALFVAHADSDNGAYIDVDPSPYIVNGDTSIVPGKWEHVVIPLSELGACNTILNGLLFSGAQKASSAPPPLYFGTVALSPGKDSACGAAPSPSNTPTPTTPPAPTSTPIPTKAPTSGSAMFTLSPVSQTLNTNTNFSLMVHVNTPTTQPINAVEPVISYPASLVKVVSFNNNAMSTPFGTPYKEINDPSTGTITIVSGSPAPVTGDNHIVTINFQTLSTPGQATISFSSKSQVVSSVTNAFVNILSSPSGVYTIASPSIPGDLNGDGFVNATDLGILLTNWGSTTPGNIADINRDGVVNIIDLSILLSHWTP